MAADLVTPLVAALAGAGVWKTVDWTVKAVFAEHKRRKIERGEAPEEPKNLQGYLLQEVRLLRTDLARMEERNRQLAEEHSDCRKSLAVMQGKLDHLQGEVVELQAKSEAAESELAAERTRRRRPARGVPNA